MTIKRFTLLFVVLTFSAVVRAQTEQEPQKLEPGKAIERKIAGGESHTCQIKQLEKNTHTR